MVTAVKSEAMTSKVINGTTTSRAVFNFVGLPGDTKPVGEWKGILIGNGSRYFEFGGTMYSYDEENGVWIEDAGNSSGGGADAGAYLTAQVLQIIALATDNTPITRIVVEDAAETEIEAGWNKEYVIPGDSLESLSITLEEAPTAVSSCIKVTILGISRHEDPEDNTLLVPPTITLPEGLVIVGGFPEEEGDRWVLTIDNNLTATAMVIPNPPAEGDTEGET